MTYSYTGSLIRDVAQPGSAPALGAGGRRFESAHPDHRPTAKPDSRLVL